MARRRRAQATHRRRAPVAGALLLWYGLRGVRASILICSRRPALTGGATHVPRPHALSPVQRLLTRRVRAPLRAHALDQGALQALRALPAAARPHPRDGVREGLDAHPRVVRGRHEPAGRHRDQPEPQRHAAVARRADRGRRPRDLADGRRRDDPHVRAVDHRALRRAFARAGDQRPHQRVPPLPDPRRPLHVPRAPGPGRRQDRRVDRRLEQRLHDLAAGGRDLRLHRARVDAAGLRGADAVARTLDARPLPVLRRSGRGVPRRRPRDHRRVDQHGLRGGERGPPQAPSPTGRSTPR